MTILPEKDTELQGQIERVTYTDEAAGYAVAKLRVKGRRDLVTVAGNIHAPNPGEVLRLKGQWVNHPRYGEQFRINSYESVIPATAAGIERYLGSGLIRGIGPIMAKRIVAAFGTDTFAVIEDSIEKLRQVEGVGTGRIEMIRKAWDEHKEIREVMLFLQDHGVGSAYATKIFRHYGKEAIRILKENPYRMAHDIFGIGFLTADRIAGKLGIAKDSPMRAEAGIVYVLHRLADEGHVCCPYEELIAECARHLDIAENGRKILEIGRETITRALAALALDKRIVMEEINEGEIRENNKAVYLAKYHICETGIAESLKRLLGAAKQLSPFDPAEAVTWAQRDLGIELSQSQMRAVTDSISNKVMVITGGPGTGKTTIIRAIIRIYGKLSRSILLAAPTGRAAKRMSEATGLEAKTMHRLLEFSPQDAGFKRNDDNPLEADLIVIDEVSMVDTVLMYHLLRAVPDGATLVLVGDVDQLPSVGAGDVLRDIIDSGLVPTVRLTEIFRQSGGSLIVMNAHRVNRGEMPYLGHDPEKPQDFYFMPAEQPEEILDKVIRLCKDRIPGKFGFDPVRDIQVITAMHKGIVGTVNLNRALQEALNPSPDELSRGARVFRRGDKVMQIVNNYDRETFNGDIGTITVIDRESQELTVDYEGRLVAYDFNDLDEIVQAYATSVHKSQGSEYPAVVIPVHTQHYLLLQRNLLYTAITRGKKLVVIVGTKKALAIAVRNDKLRKRHTRLKQRLTQ
ncbi:MAG: ATP-dependent RecD-like DNA helicase [Chloroflexota bacterium]